MGRTGRKKADRFERTDDQLRRTDDALLESLHSLSVDLQRAHTIQIFEHAREREKVVPFDELLADPPTLDELQRLGASCGIQIAELAQIVNPFRYSSYFARSPRCTMTKLTSVDSSHSGETSETVVYVRAYRPVEFRHSIVPADFDLHIVHGEARIENDGNVTRARRGTVARIEAGGQVLLRLAAAAWVLYVEHPLTTWIRHRAAETKA